MDAEMIRVQAFARYRERLGFQSRDFPLPSPPTLAALLADPALADLPADALFALNRTFADRGTGLADGDEVAIFPPVSGG
jgi:molybdopterin converting factor small subunit